MKPKFGWLSTDVIRKTFDQTTQFHRRPLNNLNKHFKTPHPACDVSCCQEAIVTDMAHSDALAIDDGTTMAQLFVGTESLVTDVCGMKTES